MNNIAVSVIVPIYNVENYLGECLDSLQRQTFTDFEVIMVNDGSIDQSEDIARKYAERNENFKLIIRRNGGLSAARNTGLNVACGEYVYFLDSDDFLADDAIELLYRKAKTENLDQLRFAAYTFIDSTKDYKWIRDKSLNGYKYLGEYTGVYNGIDFYRKTFEKWDYFPSCCLILSRRSVIDKYHLRFYEGIVHEDNLFNFQLTTLCERVALLHKPLYYRRIRPGSIMQDTDYLERIRSMCISVEEADRFIESYPQTKGEISINQISFFTNMMFSLWEKMTRDEQESAESREYFDRIKPFIAKYENGGNKSQKLFYVSHPLYRAYKWTKHMADKVLCGD